jgi:hypothetical protein
MTVNTDGHLLATDTLKNGPLDLVMVSLCIQIAIEKMQLCLLSVAYAYAYPYHNPTSTMEHSVHNVDISKPLANTPCHTHALRM